MADPVTIALVASAASSAAGGVAAMGQAKGEKLQADINADISETQAIQDGTTKAEQTASELATMRATMASNGQGVNSGTEPFMKELRRVRSRESRITQGNYNRQAEDFRIQGKNSMQRGRAGLIKGLGGSASSIFDIAQLNSR